MSNFVIDSSEINDDLAWEYESVYCTNCKSCGELGCECWGRCSVLTCKYGETLIDQYEDLKRDCNIFFLMLTDLGIENPYAIDLDRIKDIASKENPFIEGCGCLRDAISYYYDLLRDPEE